MLQPKVDPPIETHIGTQSPVVQRPTPLGIRIIERYLREKRMRLIDLFARVDKNKNWVISRDEFRDTIQRVINPKHSLNLLSNQTLSRRQEFRFLTFSLKI